MSVKKEKGFVLKAFVINERDRVVVLLNEQGQKVSLIAKGGNNLKSRFQGKLEPFCFVLVNYFDSEKKGLKPLNEVELIENLQGWVKGDMKKFLSLSFLTEAADRFVYEKEKNPRIFRLINHVISSLKKGVDLRLGISYFSVWILKLSGLLKDFEEEIPCLNEILEKPLDKLNCKDTKVIFELGMDLISKSSDQTFNSAEMLKSLI